MSTVRGETHGQLWRKESREKEKSWVSRGVTQHLLSAATQQKRTELWPPLTTQMFALCKPEVKTPTKINTTSFLGGKNIRSPTEMLQSDILICFFIWGLYQGISTLESPHGVSSIGSLLLEFWLWTAQPFWEWEIWTFAQEIYSSNHVPCFPLIIDQQNHI